MIIVLDLVSCTFWIVGLGLLHKGIGVWHRILRMEDDREGRKGYMLDDAAREGKIYV